MSGLMNKLTGHHNNDQVNQSHDHGKHSTTTTQTTTTNSALPNQSINQSTGLNSANIATNAPYGSSTATSTQRTGAAYTDASITGNQPINQSVNQPRHDDAITRSEEQLHVAKATVETGTAQLNKYVSVDHVDKQIPVSRERLVIERFPINESNIGSFSNAVIGEQRFETTICEDRIAAMKEIVPIERIRLAKEVEGHVEHVGADLRKEHVDYVFQPLAAGAKNDDGLAHHAQARHDQAYDAHRKTDSSYDQAAVYDPSRQDAGSVSTARASLPGTHHSGHSGMHSAGTNPLSDKVDNIGRSGHGLGAGMMQGNALATGTGRV